MDVLKKFKTSEEKETTGVWIPLEGNAKILVARIPNQKYQKALQKKTAQYRFGNRLSNIAESELERILIEVMAETVLLGWEGFLEGDKPLPYSKENATRLLKGLRDFRDFVADIARDMTIFKEEVEEADIKN